MCTIVLFDMVWYPVPSKILEWQHVFDTSWLFYMHRNDFMMCILRSAWINWILQVFFCFLFCSKFQLHKHPETYPCTRGYQDHASAPIIGWQCLLPVGTITCPPARMLWWWNCTKWDTEKHRGDTGLRKKEKWRVCKLLSQAINKNQESLQAADVRKELTNPEWKLNCGIQPDEAGKPYTVLRCSFPKWETIQEGKIMVPCC